MLIILLITYFFHIRDSKWHSCHLFSKSYLFLEDVLINIKASLGAVTSKTYLVFPKLMKKHKKFSLKPQTETNCTHGFNIG